LPQLDGDPAFAVRVVDLHGLDVDEIPVVGDEAHVLQRIEDRLGGGDDGVGIGVLAAAPTSGFALGQFAFVGDGEAAAGRTDEPADHGGETVIGDRSFMTPADDDGSEGDGRVVPKPESKHARRPAVQPRRAIGQ
jgi:hypothetical protein